MPPSERRCTPDGSKVYVTNAASNTVSVIDTATNTVTATIPVGSGRQGVAVTPDGSKVYVANTNSPGTVSVIDTATNTVTATVPVRFTPANVAVTPDGSAVYVSNVDNQNVIVIDTATNTVTATIRVGIFPSGIAAAPDGSKVYVANFSSNTVSVIDTATNTVTATIGPVGNGPDGLGGQPRWQQGLCHEHSRQHRVGDRHGDQYGNRHDPRRQQSHRRGGNPGRQRGLCRERRFQHRVGDRHGDQHGDRHDPGRHLADSLRHLHTAPISPIAESGCHDGLRSRLQPGKSNLQRNRDHHEYQRRRDQRPLANGLHGADRRCDAGECHGQLFRSPYLTIAAASLAPGQSATVSVQFENPLFATINFTPVIYSGSI